MGGWIGNMPYMAAKSLLYSLGVNVSRRGSVLKNHIWVRCDSIMKSWAMSRGEWLSGRRLETIIFDITKL